MQLHLFAGCVAAFLFASWAFAIALFIGTVGLVPVSYTVVLTHAVVLGLPIFLIFWWRRWVNFFMCTCGGFLVAAASGIRPTWPVAPKGSSRSAGGVPLVLDGVPTWAGWIEFLQVLIFLGVFGAIAGIVFWAVLRASGALSSANGVDPSERRRAISLAVVAVLITGTLIAIPNAVWERLSRLAADQTCHNVLRDRDSISPKVSIDLQIAQDDLPKLIQAMQEFAARHELQLRDASVPTRFWMSLCNDQGVTIHIDSLASISVFELKPNSGWQPTTIELIGRLENLWPGKLQFRAPQGGYMPRPKELQ